MSTEENKELVRRFVDRIGNQGDLSVIHEMLPEDFTEHEVLPPGTPQGRDGVEYFFRQWRQGFSHRQMVVMQM